jgi:type I restriction enzyme M protein
MRSSSSCAGAMQYVPELTWLLFLRILDMREQKEEKTAEVLGNPFIPSLSKPYRWRDWANRDGTERKNLTDGSIGAYFDFVNTKLIPHLKTLKDMPEASASQKVISEIMSGVKEKGRVDNEKDMLDVLDKIDGISDENVDDTHIFPLSQIYEGLLLKMGEKGNDGGQYFTPREIIRALV